ncbi:hypothetical protein KDK_28040 [Dictyobacter kobayashii]|uniref:Uncharacterized protein n=2 Tax=Dictyobacter kobayashii TaxID=2014872 RepID=A0A402AIX3_9CHLR|nr:hypothetical protein KDK_28040 [Dictyobacter kobayashii]
MIRSYAKIQLIATENGLLKKGPFRQQLMPWNEVRLFAIDSVSIERNGNPLFVSRHTHAPTFFELSSEKDILCWQWLRPPRWYELAMARPVMGYQVYEQQMQALLSIIVAKTGQPLYDLR